MSKVFLTPQEAKEKIEAGELKPVDASWYLPTQGRNAQEEFWAAHLPQAVFFDIDACAAPCDLPHMLPSAEDFSAYVAGLGIESGEALLIYDGAGLFSAARLWWMFRAFSYDGPLFLLEKGLPGWKAAELPLQSGKIEAIPPQKAFSAKLKKEAVVDARQLLKALESKRKLVLDARPKGRFEGSAPEPRPGLPSGHMPGAKNLPFASLIEEGKMKSPEELRAAFAATGWSAGQEVIVSCGSGVSAAVLALALELLGEPAAQLYDGSWSEWGAREDLPKVTGAW